jgi:ribonuclease PH
MSTEKKTENVHLSNHRVVMHLHKGGLHRALGISEDKEIPEDRLEAATHSNNEHIKRMATLAKTMKSWKH